MRMLINLTENAIHYGRPGGTVRLTLHRQGEAAVGTVEDDGIGIAPQDREKIWQRFWQADPHAAAAGPGWGFRWCSGSSGHTAVPSRCKANPVRAAYLLLQFL